METNGQFFVKTDSGTITIPLDLNMNLDQLKDIIGKRKQYPREIYFLKYNGHAMYENKTLKEYSLQRDQTIHVCIRNSRSDVIIN